MAAVGGVAYMGAKRGTARAEQQAQAQQQQQAQAQQEVQPAPPPPPEAKTEPESGLAGAPDRIAQLKDLAELKDAGALTQEEFDREKAKLLS
jgi:hypothetical protein